MTKPTRALVYAEYKQQFCKFNENAPNLTSEGTKDNMILPKMICPLGE